MVSYHWMMPEKLARKISLESLDAKIDTKIDALDTKFNAKIDAMGEKFDAKIDALEGRIIRVVEGQVAGITAKVILLILEMKQVKEKISELDERMGLVEKEQRRIGVLVEELDGKFKLTLDGYMAVSKRLQELDERVEKGFEEVDFKFDYMTERFEKVDTRLDAIETKLDRKVDREEFAAFQERVLMLGH